MTQLWRECICNLNNLKGPCASPRIRAARSHLYHGSNLAQQLPGEPEVVDAAEVLDGRSCDVVPDHVAVAYFVHRQDLAKIAPLWRRIIIELIAVKDQLGERHYRYLQLGWCAEMYAYIFAAAALRIRHKIVPGQVVSSSLK